MQEMMTRNVNSNQMLNAHDYHTLPNELASARM